MHNMRTFSGICLCLVIQAISSTDSFSAEWTYTYDVMDRLKTRTDPLGRTETYDYDFLGNLIKLTDQKGQVATFTYDPLNRLATAQWADGRTTTFVYGADNQLLFIQDSQSGTIEYHYDRLDRVVQEITPLSSITYQYNALGRRVAMTVNGGAPVTYVYDAASRLIQIAQGSQIINLEYNAVGRRTKLTYPNGTVSTYSYDSANRLTGITHSRGTTTFESITYTLDPSGNRINAVRWSQAATVLPKTLQAEYDSANQQIKFNSDTPNLTYDANGNLLTKTDPAGTTNYTWDARNRLLTISGPGLTANFSYDALGRRVSKTVNGVTTRYIYDRFDVVAEISGGAISATYLRNLNIDEPFGRYVTSPAPSTEFYHADALGSILALTDGVGAVQTTYTYAAFGDTTAVGSPSTNPFQFTGRENDGTGLYYYRARYYSPELHRFIREDPLGLAAGGVNYYLYALNNPLSYYDPFGLDTWGGGIQVQAGAGASGSAFVGVVGDSTGQVGVSVTVGAGGSGGAGASVTGEFTTTNAPSIQDTAGTGGQAGVQVGPFPPTGGLVIGAGIVSGSGYTGGSVNIGYGIPVEPFPPYSTYGEGTYTWVWCLVNCGSPTNAGPNGPGSGPGIGPNSGPGPGKNGSCGRKCYKGPSR